MVSSANTGRMQETGLSHEGKVHERAPAIGPMQTALDMLAGPWTLYLAWTLLKDGPLRFGELRRHVPGISSKVLTERLRMLEREGFVHRRYEPSVPPQVTYESTIRLRELTPVLDGFKELAELWYGEKRDSVAS
jgi:DNA-binding HxlR family transcriptional regulator